jgi:hypothetical protein
MYIKLTENALKQLNQGLSKVIVLFLPLPSLILAGSALGPTTLLLYTQSPVCIRVQIKRMHYKDPTASLSDNQQSASSINKMDVSTTQVINTQIIKI